MTEEDGLLSIDPGKQGRAALKRRLEKENLNASTIFGRAVQLYDMVNFLQEEGAEIIVRKRVTRHGFPWLGRSGWEYERLVIIAPDGPGDGEPSPLRLVTE